MKVHNANHKLVCIIAEDGSIIIQGKGCKTIIKPDKAVSYKITASKN